jgi:hypothetical protein
VNAFTWEWSASFSIAIKVVFIKWSSH